MRTRQSNKGAPCNVHTPTHSSDAILYVPLAHHSREKGISRRLMFSFSVFFPRKGRTHAHTAHRRRPHLSTHSAKRRSFLYEMRVVRGTSRNAEGCIGPHKLSPVCSCSSKTKEHKRNKECRIVLCVLCGPSSFGGRHSRRPHIIYELYEDGQTDC